MHVHSLRCVPAGKACCPARCVVYHARRCSAQDTEDMWARKLQQLTDMGVIPDYRSVRANAARAGGHSPSSCTYIPL